MSYLIGLVCAFLFAISLTTIASSLRVGLVFLILSILSMYGCVTNPTLQKEREEEAKESAIKDAECRKPKLAASVNGIELWSYQDSCNSRPVYFSKSGTSQEECHRSGKHRRCTTMITPNTIKQ